jgi:hypothetical protein
MGRPETDSPPPALLCRGCLASPALPGAFGAGAWGVLAVTLLFMMRRVRWLWPLAVVLALGAVGWGVWDVGHSPNRTDLSTYWAFVVGVVAAIAALVAVIPVLRARRASATDPDQSGEGEGAPANTPSPAPSAPSAPSNVQISGNTFHGPAPIQGSGTQHNRFGS